MNNFAKILKELRIEEGLTQKQLADKIQSTADIVHFWEKGRSEPSIDDLLCLSAVFAVSVDYLLTGNEYFEKRN